MSNPKPQEIWLVRFPFSDLTSTKVRPALILAVHREEAIILGIFSLARRSLVEKKELETQSIFHLNPVFKQYIITKQK